MSQKESTSVKVRRKMVWIFFTLPIFPALIAAAATFFHSTLCYLRKD
jgi:hypothetical protein